MWGGDAGYQIRDDPEWRRSSGVDAARLIIEQARDRVGRLQLTELPCFGKAAASDSTEHKQRRRVTAHADPKQEFMIR
jgi:hypothetical protein